MKLLESDLKILRVLLDHGQLSTRQVAREVERMEASVRRRMRGFLVREQYVLDLGRLRVCDQKLYALGRRGLELMAAERGSRVELLPVSAKAPRGYASVLEPHRRLVADLRIAAHLAARQEQCQVALWASFHDGQLSNDPERRASRSRWDKFLLGWKLEDPLDPGEHCGCIPDVLLVLSPRTQPATQMSCFVEADRGTEHIEGGPIWQKLRSYFSMWVLGAFANVPERPALRPSGMRVLFVLAQRTRWRITAMRHALSKFIETARRILDGRGSPEIPTQEFGSIFRFALAEELLAPEIDFFTSPVWETAGGSRVPLFRGLPAAEVLGNAG